MLYGAGWSRHMQRERPRQGLRCYQSGLTRRLGKRQQSTGHGLFMPADQAFALASG